VSDDPASVPVSGSLSAKVIRACRDHGNKCKLDCPRREVEDLGEIASFLSTPEPESQSWLLEQAKRFFRR